MRRQVKVDVREGVAIISLASVPEAGPRGADPGFDARLRAELAQALATVSANRNVGAVLLRAGAAGWPEAGDPEAESGEATEPPTLAEIAATIEAMAKPVVISLDGRLGGATLALAFASGWRIAAQDAVFAPAEPDEGRLSPAGLLVRAARRAGARSALLLAQPGRVIGAAEAASLWLCDGVVENGDVGAAALSVARGLARDGAAGSGPPRRRDGAGLGEPAAFMAALASARAALAQQPQVLRPAAGAAIDVVEAALLLEAPAALAFAEVARDDQEANPASRALQHLVAAERRARLRVLHGAKVGAGVKIAGSVGFWEVAPLLGAPLAEALAASGLRVLIASREEAPLAETLSTVARAQEAAVVAGRLSGADRVAAWGRIEAVASASDMAGCAWVLARADAAADLPPAVPLVLEGSLSPAFPAAAALRLAVPGLCEVASAGAGNDAASAMATHLLRAHFTVLRSGAGQFGLLERLSTRLFAAAERAVLAGARPDQVDAALGLADPPFRRADRLGLARVVADQQALGHRPGPLSLRLLAEQRLGRPGGFYRGAGLPEAQAVADVTALLAGLRAEAGIEATPLSPAQIRARLLAELADEGAAMLQDGLAEAAGDIDVASVLGLGLPRSIGGPMHAADRAGLLATRNLLRTLSSVGGGPPEAMWDVLIRNGRCFGDLDKA